MPHKVLHDGAGFSTPPASSLPPRQLCGLLPPWPSFSFPVLHISVQSGPMRTVFSAQNSTSLFSARPVRAQPECHFFGGGEGGGLFLESPACIRSSCVALYSSVLILCNSLVSIFLTSMWAPGGQGLCAPCSSRRPSLPSQCQASGRPRTHTWSE